MNEWSQPFVLDTEAYQERAAIMLVESDGTMTDMEIYSYAAHASYDTPFALAATSAVRGDWEPAKELCRRQPDGYGRLLMRAIQEAVRDKRAMM